MRLSQNLGVVQKRHNLCQLVAGQSVSSHNSCLDVCTGVSLRPIFPAGSSHRCRRRRKAVLPNQQNVASFIEGEDNSRARVTDNLAVDCDVPWPHDTVVYYIEGRGFATGVDKERKKFDIEI